MIEVRHLTKKYGAHTAVKDLSFTIDKGVIYGFLGPNGAGKSTTMNIITGCLGATEGEVLVDGHSVADEPMQAKKKIGYLPEQPPVYMDMTPAEYLRFVASAKGVAKAEIGDQVEYVMDQTDITTVRNRLIRNLSKGYRQRVGIAQALLGNPEVIILDEPTVGLDPAQIIEIRDLIKELGKDHTIILSSHILSEVQAVCGYIMIIADGRLVASDTPENLSKLFAGTTTVRLEAKGGEEQVKALLEEVRKACEDAGNPGEFGEITCRPAGNGICAAEMKLASGSIKPAAENDPEPAGEAGEKPAETGTQKICETLFRIFAKADVPLLELHSERASLEDIFLELTQGETAADDRKEGR